MTHRSVWILLLLLTGCQVAPLPIARGIGSDARHRLDLMSGRNDDPAASLIVHLQSPLRERIQTLPSSWDTATIRLDGPALKAPSSRTLVKGTDLMASGSTYVATGAFGDLRPTTYRLTVDLWYGGVSGTLEAEQQQTVNLVAGVNAVTVSTQVYPSLGLFAFSPASGVPGDAIRLSGQAFSVLPDQDQLSLGPLGAVVTAASSVSLTTTIPNLGPGSYPWQLQVGSSLAGKAGFNVLGTLGSALYWLTLPSQQTFPAIAHGSDRYLVAWDDSRNGGADLYGRLVDASGATLVSDFSLVTGAGAQQKPQIAYNPGLNQFAVVYQDGANSGDIRAQVVNANGTLSGGNLGICTLASAQTLPSVAFGSTKGQYAAVWLDNRNGKPNVYGQLANADLSLLGTSLAIQTGNTNMNNPSITYAPTVDKFLVVWDNDFQPKIIQGRILNSDGTLGPGPFTLSPVITVDQAEPVASFDPTTGNFLVAWATIQNPFGIYGQLVSPSGSLVGSTVTLASPTGASKNYPAIAFEPWRQKFVVAWNDQRSSNWQVYGQFVGTNGSLWGSNFNVSNLVSNDTNCALDVDPTNQRGMVAYQDASNGGDVYGQVIR